MTYSGQIHAYYGIKMNGYSSDKNIRFLLVYQNVYFMGKYARSSHTLFNQFDTLTVHTSSWYDLISGLCVRCLCWNLCFRACSLRSTCLYSSCRADNSGLWPVSHKPFRRSLGHLSSSLTNRNLSRSCAFLTRGFLLL